MSSYPNVDEMVMTYTGPLPNLQVELFDELDIEDYGTNNAIIESNIQVHPIANDDDATLESPMQFKPLFLPPLGPPDRTEIKNKHNFAVEISSKNTNKKKYLYSAKLNRVFVDMNTDFAVQFSWQHCAAPMMYVRATVVFSDKEQAQKRVERCLQHRHENTAGIPKEVVMHVLRSSRELGTRGVMYHGDPDIPDSWYSVLVECPNSGQPCQHAYKFVCKNSCPNGINRRSIAIIFTLEDATGEVVGRQLVGVRACACPRRDLIRDEELEAAANGKKRVPTPRDHPEPPKTKKIKLEVVAPSPDVRLFTLPPLKVVGSRTMLAGLETMLHMMEQAQTNGHAAEAYAQCIPPLKAAIQRCRNDLPH